MKPMVSVFRRRMFWARASGWKPSSWMAARTFSRVTARTVSGALRLRETVPTETPEAAATSLMVTDRLWSVTHGRLSPELASCTPAEPLRRVAAERADIGTNLKVP